MSSPSGADPQKVCFALYKKDFAGLKARVKDMTGTKPAVRDGTILRALVHLNSLEAMVTATARYIVDDRLAPEPFEIIAARPTPDLPKADVRKLDDAIAELGRRRMVATRGLVMAALIHAAPRGTLLAREMKRFFTEVPIKARGRTQG
ncbi:MAG: hypothetical protein JWM32_1589 [Verrucomicrobia bacterium]|nr:hypothetical protein [Verrucomicrobiota bacterium]